ncbi:MAG: nuclear transport factor 2 family protein [Desulfurellaceae bacterium]|nr:nuclear transport factor 2 family protein [Desulfurellaceae bacterium]
MASILEEKEAIRDVLSAYCFHVDGGEFDKWAELFSEDALFDAGPRGQVQGRAALRDFIAKAVPTQGEGPARKHCTMNSMIQVNGTEAKADSYIIVVREGEQGILTSLAGRYEDLLVKQGDTWRFKVRKIHFDIAGDLGLKQS